MIPESTKKFIDNLIDYYINESSSYKQMAKIYFKETKEINDCTFGIIVGSLYSGFLQAFQNLKQKPSLEDTQEFTNMIKTREVQIKKSIVDAKA